MKGKSAFSRRDFLRKSGAGAGLIGLGLSSPEPVPGYINPQGLQEKSSSREVRVMSMSKSGVDGHGDAVNVMLSRIRAKSYYKPDIICLPEIINGKIAKEAEEVTGPTTEIFSALARELNCYIICPFHVRQGKKVYNSAVLIDRKGSVAGQYNKIHPVTSECINGVTPGSHPPPVFRTDFGIIGIQICFDVNWTDEWKSLKEQGAEIVFWPSAFPAGRMLPSLAWMFKYYIVGSSWRDPSTIYDMTGDLISASGQYEHLAFAKLNMEKVLFETVDYTKRLDDIKKKYGDDILIRYYHDEDWFTIESCSPDIRIADILREYKILPHWDYINIEEKEQDKYRNAK